MQSLAANVDTFVDWKNNVLFGESFSVVSQSALKEQYKFILLIEANNGCDMAFVTSVLRTIDPDIMTVVQ